ncbi:MAG TPA: hypothetical protein VLZ83_13920 [Edaphocola sp.]|nr:hypothetical protein [Edaphocola sp.]
MKKTTILISSLLLSFLSFAQYETDINPKENLEKNLEKRTEDIEINEKSLPRLQISGYLQTQFQHGEKDATLKVGLANSDLNKSFNRFGVRRGRLKFTYKKGLATGIFQIDLTEKKIGLKEAYFSLKDPWHGIVTINSGVLNRPFGNEIGYSSSKLESPERSNITQTLFPEEQDLGVMLVLQAPKNNPLSLFKLEAGLFGGNGIKIEADNKMDFIGHLSAKKEISSNLKIGIGATYYNGNVYQGTENIYSIKNKGFVLNNNISNKNEFAKRVYYGFDGQISLESKAGLTQIRSEYLFGIQPGSASNGKSPNGSVLPNSDTYLRNFSGGYIIFTQTIGTLPFTAVLKYDWLDPNCEISKNEIGLNGTNKGDIAFHTYGFGIIWDVVKNITFQAYYDVNKNEKSTALMPYNNDLKDNALTLRLQYKF